MDPKIIQHIEAYLGKIQGGFSLDALNEPSGNQQFQIIKAGGGVVSGVCSYSTLGLSNYELKTPKENQIVHQELFLAVNDLTDSRNIPAILQSLGRECIASETAYLRGQVVGPRGGRVIRGTDFSALYVAMPAYWPDEYASCDLEDRNVVFAWLVPITTLEAEFIRSNGWNAFEDKLESSNIDMCDLSRTGMTGK